ncbi:MAG: hypothetical protein HBSIN02_02780 [Bacteroidia bacterium]|nr:MAG: hypothetical protein HBSIN02_02780 [Bacteroidia bacterium]
MSNMLDIVGSVVLFGILVITIGRVQTNLNTAMYANSFTQVTQHNAVELARQLEFDFTRIGFKTPTNKITLADSTRIKFRTDFSNTGTIREIEYRIGTINDADETPNPLDFPLYRKDQNGEIKQLWGMTQFKIEYYNMEYKKLATPVVSDSLPKIYAIWLNFVIEGREPAGSAIDTTYYSITWQKLIYPRNMGLSY